MGWGKTPLMLALIKHQCEVAVAEGRRSTSLVIVPPKLYRQWVGELKEWLGALACVNSGGGTWLRTVGGGITVWAPVDMRSFSGLDAEVAATADVVVIPYTIFSSKKYPSEASSWPEGLFDVLSRKWDRLVLDEVHELSNLSKGIQRRILAVQSGAVHALSGTPEQGGGSRGAASLALTFKASLCPMRGDAFDFDCDEYVTAAASEFLGSMARTQVSPFRLPVTEHVIFVELSEAEKVLYVNLKNHGSPTTRDLLNLCSCFVSKEASSANKEIGVLIKQKQHALAERLRGAEGHAAFVLLLSRCMVEGGVRLASRRSALRCRDERVEYWDEGLGLVNEVYERLLDHDNQELAGLVRPEDVYGIKARELLLLFSDDRFDLLEKLRGVHERNQADVKELFNEQLIGHLGRDFVMLGSLKKSLDYLEHSMTQLAGVGSSCPICLDVLENGEVTCITSCGHAFHEACISDSLKVRPRCPNCRQPVPDVYIAQPRAPMDPWIKYGTKVKVMIQKLQDIMRENPSDRLLLFLQHRDMRKKLEQAFREFEVPFLTLSGSARSQGSTIDRWQNGRDPKDFVMMLSCDEHNSGITLTRARPGCLMICFVFLESFSPCAGTSCLRIRSTHYRRRRPMTWSSRRLGASTASARRLPPWSCGVL